MGLALGQGPRLIQDYGVHLVGHFQGGPGLNQDALLGPFTGPHHNGRRCRQTQRTWTGNDQDCNANGQGKAPGLAANQVPGQTSH